MPAEPADRDAYATARQRLNQNLDRRSHSRSWLGPGGGLERGMGEQRAGRRRRTSEAPGRSGAVPVVRFSCAQAMASHKSGAQTRRQPRPGLLRQIQNLKANEEGDQETGKANGIKRLGDTDFTNLT